VEFIFACGAAETAWANSVVDLDCERLSPSFPLLSTWYIRAQIVEKSALLAISARIRKAAD
jgi:hypothetical protein